MLIADVRSASPPENLYSKYLKAINMQILDMCIIFILVVSLPVCIYLIGKRNVVIENYRSPSSGSGTTSVAFTNLKNQVTSITSKFNTGAADEELLKRAHLKPPTKGTKSYKYQLDKYNQNIQQAESEEYHRLIYKMVARHEKKIKELEKASKEDREESPEESAAREAKPFVIPEGATRPPDPF